MYSRPEATSALYIIIGRCSRQLSCPRGTTEYGMAIGCWWNQFLDDTIAVFMSRSSGVSTSSASRSVTSVMVSFGVVLKSPPPMLYNEVKRSLGLNPTLTASRRTGTVHTLAPSSERSPTMIPGTPGVGGSLREPGSKQSGFLC
jgi:hypothetical protein